MTWLSAFLLLIAALARPGHAHCPHAWWLCLGVRSSGEYACCLSTGGDLDLKPENIDLRSRVYCTNGTRAITVDGVAVGCQR